LGRAKSRAQKAPRVKEFPAGNVATSASRIRFLESLCQFPKFLSLLDLLPALVSTFQSICIGEIYLFEFQPKPSPIPTNYPAWASWKSREVYLPADFHSPAAFKRNISVLKKALADSSALEAGRIDSFLLLFGLMYREVSRSIEIEPDNPTNAPDHLVNSSFGIAELNQLDALIFKVVLPSSK
jgi:hypothetical protein